MQFRQQTIPLKTGVSDPVQLNSQAYLKKKKMLVNFTNNYKEMTRNRLY